jgi:hypothetical protein
LALAFIVWNLDLKKTIKKVNVILCDKKENFIAKNRKKFVKSSNFDNRVNKFNELIEFKTKRVCNPHGNLWSRANTTAIIATHGLKVVNNNFPSFANVRNNVRYPTIFAEQPFHISGPQCRVDGFPGTILYYYEVKCYG